MIYDDDFGLVKKLIDFRRGSKIVYTMHNRNGTSYERKLV